VKEERWIFDRQEEVEIYVVVVVRRVLLRHRDLEAEVDGEENEPTFVVELEE
jgi:hypothetical protein